VTPELSTD